VNKNKNIIRTYFCDLYNAFVRRLQVGAQGVCASFIEWYVKVVSEYQINIIIVYFFFA